MRERERERKKQRVREIEKLPLCLVVTQKFELRVL
jgi:hypothetical protein